MVEGISRGGIERVLSSLSGTKKMETEKDREGEY